MPVFPIPASFGYFPSVESAKAIPHGEVRFGEISLHHVCDFRAIERHQRSVRGGGGASDTSTLFAVNERSSYHNRAWER